MVLPRDRHPKRAPSRLHRPGLLVIDEIGFLPLDAHQANLFFRWSPFAMNAGP